MSGVQVRTSPPAVITSYSRQVSWNPPWTNDIDSIESDVVRGAIARIQADPATSSQQIDLMFIARNLERVGDHATNIAEHVVLAAESKNLKHREKLSR